MWQFLKLQINLALVSILAVVILPFLPIEHKFNPVAYNVTLPTFEGKLALNSLLDRSRVLFKNELNGPESLALKDGIIYTGTRFGDVFAIDPKAETLKKVTNTGSACKGSYEEEKCGRLLGLRFAKDGTLYGIDAYKGLLKIEIATGKVEILVPNGQYIGNSRLLFGDDLDIDDNGIIYYSQASRRWGLQQIINLVLEHDNSGRILTYNIKTKQSGVLLDNIAFPNGIQLTPDKKTLLFAELLERRIMKIDLPNPAKGATVFADNLPGGPDNIRLSPRGTYWVAFDTSRSKSTPLIADMIAPYPLIAKATIRLLHVLGTALDTVNTYYSNPALRDLSVELLNANILFKTLPQRGIIVELDNKGVILQALHSSSFTLFSEVLEMKDQLFVGSVINPYLLKVRRP